MKKGKLKKKLVAVTMAVMICTTLSAVPVSAATSCSAWVRTGVGSVHCGNPLSCGPGLSLKNWGQNIYWKRTCMDTNTGATRTETRTTWGSTGGCC